MPKKILQIAALSAPWDKFTARKVTWHQNIYEKMGTVTFCPLLYLTGALNKNIGKIMTLIEVSCVYRYESFEA